MERQSDFLRLKAEIERLETDMIAFQSAITAIPALGPDNGGEGEWDKAQYIRSYLEQHGIDDIRQIDAPDSRAKAGKRPNLIARIAGRSSERTLWLMAHMDVVPEGDRGLWDSDPWQAVVRDGKIFGRGTEDNQQGLTSSLFLLLALVNCGIQPEYDLALILAADEETGSRYGLTYVLSEQRALFRPDDLIVVPDAGEPDSTLVEVAEKSILWLKFTTKGKQCHASLPDNGINAFLAGSHLVIRLNQLHRHFSERNEVFVPPNSTFTPTKKEANVGNINTMPGQDVFYLDCRILPTCPIDEVLEAVRDICRGVEQEFAVQVQVDIEQRADAAPATPVNAPVVTRLLAGIRAVYGVEGRPQGIGGGTVAAVFRDAGLPAVVWSTLDDMCHQPNEYCVISYMVKDALVLGHLCLQA